MVFCITVGANWRSGSTPTFWFTSASLIISCRCCDNVLSTSCSPHYQLCSCIHLILHRWFSPPPSLNKSDSVIQAFVSKIEFSLSHTVQLLHVSVVLLFLFPLSLHISSSVCRGMLGLIIFLYFLPSFSFILSCLACSHLFPSFLHSLLPSFLFCFLSCIFSVMWFLSLSFFCFFEPASASL